MEYIEFIRFIIAGGAGFAIELGTIIVLKEVFSLNTLIATPIAFTFSVILNYLLCVFWVFKGTRRQGKKNKSLFVLTSCFGLTLNEFLMYLFRTVWGEEYVILTIVSFPIKMYVFNKILSACIVIIWNYFTKRSILINKLQGNTISNYQQK